MLSRATCETALECEDADGIDVLLTVVSPLSRVI